MKTMLRYAIPAFIALLAISGSLWSVWHPAPSARPRVIHCAHLQQDCSFNLNNRPVHLHFSSQPAGLTPFGLQVVAYANQVNASFSMQGMNMGTIRYALKSAAENQWQADITLPVCVTGRQDWLMMLDIDGRQVAIPFTSTG